MVFSTARLEGRALEHCFLRVKLGDGHRIRGIRMQAADGTWSTVTDAKDPRVNGVLKRMQQVASGVVTGLNESGWTVDFCEQLVEVNEERHSVDLVLTRADLVLFVEVKWSGTLRRARAEGRKVLREWMRSAGMGCTRISPGGQRRHATAECAVLAVSPFGWSLDIESAAHVSSVSGAFSNESMAQCKAMRGRSGTSGSAKRSRSVRAYRTEQERRQNEGRVAHNLTALACMKRRKRSH
jgi:hypothetical protein